VLNSTLKSSNQSIGRAQQNIAYSSDSKTINSSTTESKNTRSEYFSKIDPKKIAGTCCAASISGCMAAATGKALLAATVSGTTYYAYQTTREAVKPRVYEYFNLNQDQELNEPCSKQALAVNSAGTVAAACAGFTTGHLVGFNLVQSFAVFGLAPMCGRYGHEIAQLHLENQNQAVPQAPEMELMNR